MLIKSMLCQRNMGRHSQIDQEIGEFARKLKSVGLQKAVVLGTYFWTDPIPTSSMENSTNDLLLGLVDRSEWRLPKVVKEFDLRGCVGEVINELLCAGIRSFPGKATFKG